MLQVDIEHLVYGWEDLIDEIDRRLDPHPDVVYMPRNLDDVHDIDRQLLRMLWATLCARGLNVVAARVPSRVNDVRIRRTQADNS